MDQKDMKDAVKRLRDSLCGNDGQVRAIIPSDWYIREREPEVVSDIQPRIFTVEKHGKYAAKL